jgi:hypothetical protein
MGATLKSHGLLFQNKKLDKGYVLNTPSPTERGELEVLTAINSYILKIGTPITLKIGSFTLKNVYGANKVEGTPKADISLVCYNSSKKRFEDCFYLSHKMGAGAEGFQQYSGITEKADGRKTGSISKDSEVIEFLRTISKLQDSITVAKERYYRRIKNRNLIAKAIYGPEFGASDYGLDNIHAIAQGKAIMKAMGSIHTLTFSHEICFNPDVSTFQSGEYTTIIGARYTSGRNYEVDGKTYSGARILIMPKRLIGGNAKEV